MAETDVARIIDDGTHLIPLKDISRLGEAPIVGSSGELRWSRADGLSFRLELPCSSLSSLGGLPTTSEKTATAGSVRKVDFTPEWIARASDGSEVQLIATAARTRNEVAFNSAGTSARSVVSGAVMYAKVSFGRESPLAFWSDTEVGDRLFFLGLDLSVHWPKDEVISCKLGTAKQSRSSLILSEEHQMTIYRADGLPQGVAGAWLTYRRSEQADPYWFEPVCEDVRGLISFLVGRWTPFVWRDTFLDDSRLERLYYGWNRQKTEPSGLEQPVPLGRTMNAIKYGNEVVKRLPLMLAKFSSLPSSYNLEWILTPLWLASDTFTDEKLALACVSLERLSTAYDKTKRLGIAIKRPPLLTSMQLAAVCQALKPTLRGVASKEGITDEVVAILEKKIDNFHQTPNADKLAVVFTELGIDLTDEEMTALKNRNECLHGRATLTDGEDIAAVDAELRRVDTLRTLIHRAVLLLLDYDGPYVDYGTRPTGKNSTIRNLSLTPNAHVSARAGEVE